MKIIADVQSVAPSRLSAPLRVGIAGLGTVGGGVVKLLQDHAALIAQRCGQEIIPVAVSARDAKKSRPFDGEVLKWHDRAEALAEDPAIDIVVEAIGGAEGPALRLVEAALKAGKPVVTANKALLALHGRRLAQLAEDRGVALAYEAAVAGGIPVIKTLREGLAANQFSRVYGILNGTSNYILTTMRETGRDFAEVLADAQALGYAEADPSFDIDGVDAAHKLCLLSGLAFGGAVPFDQIYVEGIRHIAAQDIAFAAELGYRIKLLAMAERTADNALSLRVHPAMVSLKTAIAHVEGVFNAVVSEGDFVGQTMIEGRGAGAGPTASAVVADLIDFARGHRPPFYGVPLALLQDWRIAPIDQRYGAYYVRLMVLDRPGVVADVSAALRDEGVSMESMIQRGRAPNDAVPIVLTTHEAPEAQMQRALARIARLPTITEPPCVIRIETL